MTRKQRYLRKLGNAIRAKQGSYTRPPQTGAETRLRRWWNRCLERGYINPVRIPRV
jgi:hypothetical protein